MPRYKKILKARKERSNDPEIFKVFCYYCKYFFNLPDEVKAMKQHYKIRHCISESRFYQLYPKPPCNISPPETITLAKCKEKYSGILINFSANLFSNDKSPCNCNINFDTFQSLVNHFWNFLSNSPCTDSHRFYRCHLCIGYDKYSPFTKGTHNFYDFQITSPMTIKQHFDKFHPDIRFDTVGPKIEKVRPSFLDLPTLTNSSDRKNIVK